MIEGLRIRSGSCVGLFAAKCNQQESARHKSEKEGKNCERVLHSFSNWKEVGVGSA